MNQRNAYRYGAEVLGSFFLAFVVGFQDPLITGLTLMALMYTFGSVSGGHFNPIVTLSLWLCSAFSTSQVAPYLWAQAGGALMASIALYAVGGNYIAIPFGQAPLLLFGVELLFGFLFAALALSVLVAGREEYKHARGIIIGLALVAFASLGAVINPAIALASIVNHIIFGDVMSITFNLAAHVGGPIVGAVIASFWFFYSGQQNGVDFISEKSVK